MKVEELYKMQIELDQRIIEQKELEGQDLIPNTVLALQVELGECANEWRGFKHWSADKQPRTSKFVLKKEYQHLHITQTDANEYQLRDEFGKIVFDDVTDDHHDHQNPLLEEYVDCLHFFLSLARQLEVDPSYLFRHSNVEEEEISKIFTLLINRVGKIGEAQDRETKVTYLYMASTYFIHLGACLGFVWEQIAAAYVAKNQVNHSRQATGY